MTKIIDYYLSLVSPWTYFGGERLAEMAARHGAEVRVKPIDLGVVFPASGGLPLAKRAPQRQAYRLVELERWRRRLDMPLNLHPKHFPAPEGLAARMVIAAPAINGDALRLSQAILKAVWAEERNIADASTLLDIARECGLHAQTLLAAAVKPEVAAAYQGFTEEAAVAGVFGAPTYAIDGELFWGQDRLDFVERKLAAM